MSAGGEAFVAALGRPDPAGPPGLSFPNPVDQETWDYLYPEVGAGYYLNRFLYLFGANLSSLEPCLQAWSFLLPTDGARVILGRNAYGALLILENANLSGTKSRVYVLDPIGVVYRRNPQAALENLFGYWLPNKALPNFFNSGIYDTWVAGSGRYLADDEILGIKVPLGLGGSLALDNFQPEPIVRYYQTTGPIYAKAFAQMAASAGRPPADEDTGKKTEKPGRGKRGGKRGKT
ncbi:MAG TPA: hypothetical protein VF516_13945 [Kofleriaceae bacterium]